MFFLKFFIFIALGSTFFGSTLCDVSSNSKPLKYKVSYYLYTSKNRKGVSFSKFDCSFLNKNGFTPESQIVFIIPGWNDQMPSKWALKMKKAQLMYDDDSNVIIVDWTSCSLNPSYTQVVTACIKNTTADLAKFVGFLISKGVSGRSIQLIGHSAGAQMAAGLNKYGLVVSRITALDPVGSGLTALGKADARVIDVIFSHKTLIGMTQLIGDMNFYVRHKFTSSVRKTPNDPTNADRMAAAYYTQSLMNPQQFPGFICKTVRETEKGDNCKESKTYMGVLANHGKQGIYYVGTDWRKPRPKPKAHKLNQDGKQMSNNVPVDIDIPAN